jgi:hypothetical protein
VKNTGTKEVELFKQDVSVSSKIMETRFEVFTAVKIQVEVFWVVTP